MFCSSCGKEIGRGSHFCAFCGTEVVLPNPSGSHECSNTPDYTIDELLESVRRGKGGKGFLTDSTAIRNAITGYRGLSVPQGERLIALIGEKPDRRGGLLITGEALYFQHLKKKHVWHRMSLEKAVGLTVKAPASFWPYASDTGRIVIVGRAAEWAEIVVGKKFLGGGDEACAAVLDGFMKKLSALYCQNAYELPENAASLEDFVEAKHCAKTEMPFGTLGLIGFCVFVYLIEFFRFGWNPSPSGLLAMGGNCGLSISENGEVWRLVTSCFLHGDVFHLAMNMFCLWSFGALFEKMSGTRHLLLAFMLCGIGGGIASAFLNSNAVSVGASGAIFGLAGVMTTYSRYFCRKEGAPHYLAKDFMVRNIAFLLVNMAIAVRANRHGASIDVVAHLGGFAMGLFFGVCLGLFRHDASELR